MKKNIMLLFLSMLSVNKDTGFIQKKPPYDLGKCGKVVETHMTNESAVHYVAANLPEGQKLDKLYVFTSKAASENVIVVKEPGFEGEYTSTEYFKLRLRRFLPNIDEIYEEIAYKEEDALKSIAKSARAVQAYAAGYEEVGLSVDLTGGFRNANMAILNIVKLLQYGGIKVDNLLYSHIMPEGQNSYVEEANDIYRLLDLISGAEEFVRFGSVESVLAYYQGKQDLSAGLGRLLKAMDDFSKEIKLCHYGSLKHSIGELHEALQDFEADKENINDLLLDSLLRRIHAEYDVILSDDIGDIELIEWCLGKDLLQQALVLYTERMPEILGNEGVISFTEYGLQCIEKEKKQQKDRGELPTTNYYELFITVQDPQAQSKKDKCQQKVLEEIKAIIQDKKQEPVTAEECRSKLLEAMREIDPDGIVILENLDDICEKLAAYRRIPYVVNKLGQDISEAKADFWIEAYLAYEKSADNLTIKYHDCVNDQSRYKKCLKAYFLNMKVNKWIDLLSVYPGVRNVMRLEKYVNEKMVSSLVPLEKLLLVGSEYQEIRDERNISSHAKSKISGFTFDQLKDKMTLALAHLRAVIDSHDDLGKK
ncbi:MAG: TM1812 family CRISPR-associated protein [Selenomonadaceae bacterium]|nr:TM1812 family CRISPR-associated protein [Selenomonadaceae bacterium]